MRSILIKLPFEMKKKLEQHPDHHYGNCDEYYLSIIQRWTDSPEYQLAIANQRIKSLESQIEWLRKDVARQKGNAEMFRRLWTESIQKASPASAGSSGQGNATTAAGKDAA